MTLISLNLSPSPRQLRQFGAIGLLAFGLIGAAVYFRHVFFGAHLSAQTANVLAIVMCVMSLACGAVAAIAPAALRPLYIALSAISYPIGLVFSHVVLAILFYGVITPIGLIMRLAGRDTMQRAFRPDLSSYWQERPPASDPRRYFRQS
jgi:hypothetical protein